MKMINAMQEKWMFLYKFLYKPGEIGSVTPSSKYLAKAMLSYVPWHEVKSAAELGAGTGAITRHIREAARENTKCLLFETDPQMLSGLKHQYPEFQCHENAERLSTALSEEGIEKLDCIISGLPFFNFQQTFRDELIEQIVCSLKDDGLFIAYQYSMQMKKQLNKHFTIEEIKLVPLNVPPAFVYVCRKNPQRKAT
jgi:phospholipid N-methyltransferase